jgi:hypothetical protein
VSDFNEKAFEATAAILLCGLVCDDGDIDQAVWALGKEAAGSDISEGDQAKFGVAIADPAMGLMFPVLGGDAAVIEATADATEDEPADAAGLPGRYDEATVKACGEAISRACEKFVYWTNNGWVNRRAPTEDFMKLDKDFNRLSKREFGVRYRKESDGKAAVWYPDTETLLSLFDDGDKRLDLVSGVEFQPGAKSVFRGPVDTGGRLFLNTWNETQRTNKADRRLATMFERHVRYLCDGDEQSAKHLIDWVAHLVQRPGERVNHAVVITSPTQGVGKDTLAEMIALVVGASNHVNVSSEILGAGYGGLFSGKLFAVVSEIYEAGNHALANSLKSKITEPRVTVNIKYGPQITVNNFTRWMLFSNHDVPLQLEESDRRFFVVKCGQPAMSEDERKAYFGPIRAAMADDAAVEGLRRWLLIRDVSHFDAKMRAPMTEAKAAMIVEGENPLVEYLRSATADGTFAAELGVRVSEEGEFGFAALQDALKRTNFAQHAKNTTELSAALEKVGLTQRRTKAGRFWRFPTAAIAAPGAATSEATAAVIEATPARPEKTARVMTAAEVVAWEAAGKPGLVTGSRKAQGGQTQKRPSPPSPDE